MIVIGLMMTAGRWKAVVDGDRRLTRESSLGVSLFGTLVVATMGAVAWVGRERAAGSG